MQLIDTHAHPHMEGYEIPAEDVLRDAQAASVGTIICVGTDAADSQRAINFAQEHEGCFASVGLHPHDSKLGPHELAELEKLVTAKTVVAVGECGLDYYYNHSPKVDQQAAFKFQIELALKHNLPLIFHVREAFGDFFKIIDEYPGVRGVVHSFTADETILQECLKRGFYIGLNGIMTFTKDTSQLEAAKAIPLESLLLETDAPFLTPVPKRGTINTPANVGLVAEFLANLRGETLEELAKVTTNNVKKLFKL